MLLAAGRGERMRPLTDACPKPLLCAGGKSLLLWHLERLAKAGFKEVVINHAHLGEQIVAAFGDGRGLGLTIAYSAESNGALETAGGIAHALPLLGADPFLVMNGDIWCDWDPQHALRVALGWQGVEALAHLVLVPNPAHHPQGDFVLDGRRVSEMGQGVRATFSGIGIYHPSLFNSIAPASSAKLGPLLRQVMAMNHVSGELHHGQWTDVGTPERLRELDAWLKGVQ